MIFIKEANKQLTMNLLIFTALLTLCSCASEKRLNLIAQERHNYITRNPNLDNEIKEAILNGNIKEGMTINDVEATLSATNCNAQVFIISRKGNMDLFIPLEVYMGQKGMLKDYNYHDPLSSIRVLSPEIPFYLKLHSCLVPIKGQEFIIKGGKVISVQ